MSKQSREERDRISRHLPGSPRHFGKFLQAHNKGKVRCGKLRYKTEDEAKQADQRGVMRAYLCLKCNGWHLTSKPRLTKPKWER